MTLLQLTRELLLIGRLLNEALPRVEILVKEVQQSCHSIVLSAALLLCTIQLDTPIGIQFSISWKQSSSP